jgi:hypothetical protein
LASCHKEEATFRVLKENMIREVEAAELLESGNQGHSLAKSSLPDTHALHFLIRYSQLCGEADANIPTDEVRKGSVTLSRFNRLSDKAGTGFLSTELGCQALGRGADNLVRKSIGRTILWTQTKRGLSSPMHGVQERMGPKGTKECSEGNLPP